MTTENFEKALLAFFGYQKSPKEVEKGERGNEKGNPYRFQKSTFLRFLGPEKFHLESVTKICLWKEGDSVIYFITRRCKTYKIKGSGLVL